MREHAQRILRDCAAAAVASGAFAEAARHTLRLALDALAQVSVWAGPPPL